jgi:hypothetical protein
VMRTSGRAQRLRAMAALEGFDTQPLPSTSSGRPGGHGGGASVIDGGRGSTPP